MIVFWEDFNRICWLDSYQDFNKNSINFYSDFPALPSPSLKFLITRTVVLWVYIKYPINRTAVAFLNFIKSCQNPCGRALSKQEIRGDLKSRWEEPTIVRVGTNRTQDMPKTPHLRQRNAPQTPQTPYDFLRLVMYQSKNITIRNSSWCNQQIANGKRQRANSK